MDIFGHHVLHCEHESYRIWRQGAQAQLLFMDLAKAARHPAVEPRPKGQHRQPPDITRLPRGNNYFRYHELASSVRRKISKCTAGDQSFASFKCGMAVEVARFRAFITLAGPGHSLLPVPISGLGGWHPGAHRAIFSIASGTASRAMA